MRRLCVGAVLLVATTAPAQSPSSSGWDLRHRLELRANYRHSDEERVPLRFPFPPSFLPPGQTTGFLETPDAGSRAELSVVQLRLDLSRGKWFTAHAQVHAVDKYRRNPTSSDAKAGIDELWFRFGEKPEFLDRPDATSFFIQLGKAPKMERQPIRLLESYGLAATAFNRFEDTQALVGGTIGRSLYWRLQVSNGNPLFFRDPNALAGDNGTPEIRQPDNPNPVPDVKSGFPIFYNAEDEDLVFNTDNIQFGQALGYRWQTADQRFGFDLILFHYLRDLAEARDLTGTFYGGDLDLLNGPFDIGGLPIRGKKKEEYGGRAYVEWRGATLIGQFTRQDLAGLERDAYELEAGYRVPFRLGWLESVQPAARFSGITSRFRGDPTRFPAPSVWWPWKKLDAGVRVGFAHNFDVTIESTRHSITGPATIKLRLAETLVTLRVRL
jgi:hypothetical protein